MRSGRLKVVASGLHLGCIWLHLVVGRRSGGGAGEESSYTVSETVGWDRRIEDASRDRRTFKKKFMRMSSCE